MPPTSQDTTHHPQPGKSSRGFASMDKAKQREIASKGGHAAHAKGTAHEFTPDEARRAGRKGGEVVSRDRAHMAAIGRAGGQRSHRNRVARARSEPPPKSEAPPEGAREEQESAAREPE
jgi:general stress protein YciG